MDRCAELQKAYSPNLYVTKETPPYVLSTIRTDDGTVPVEQALSFYEAELKGWEFQWRCTSLPRGLMGAGLDSGMRPWISGRIYLRPGCASKGY